MNSLELKIAKALGKKRMEKVHSVMDYGTAVDLYLIKGLVNRDAGENMIFEVWDYKSDYTVAEIISYAKRFVDKAEAV